ncbi:MAG TPA: F0F1 ATP synthase subunit B [Anaerolineales bacterium]|nr:F0F1 ATP synthase subunit B [Anaerolineales bacterium]
MEKLGINLGFFLVQLLNFIVVAFILSQAWKMVVDMLEKRREKIAQGLEDARVAAEARANAEKEAEKILSAARSERARLLADVNAAAEKVTADARAAAEAEKAKVVAEARVAAEAEKVNMLREVRGQIGGLAVAAANRIVEANLDAKKQQSLLDEFFSGVSNGKVTVLEGVPAGASAEVTSALPLTDAEQARFTASLGNNVSFKVDPSLLGGVLVRVGDREVDGSVKRKMSALASSLK